MLKAGDWRLQARGSRLEAGGKTGGGWTGGWRLEARGLRLRAGGCRRAGWRLEIRMRFFLMAGFWTDTTSRIALVTRVGWEGLPEQGPGALACREGSVLCQGGPALANGGLIALGKPEKPILRCSKIYAKMLLQFAFGFGGSGGLRTSPTQNRLKLG